MCVYAHMCLCGCENTCILEVYGSCRGVSMYLCVTKLWSYVYACVSVCIVKMQFHDCAWV